jgi:hypothetical protein
MTILVYASGDTSVEASGLTGYGVRGADVPSSGGSGAAVIFDSLSLPADANKEYRFIVSSLPSAGTLVLNEDTTCTFTDAPDGTYFLAGNLWEYDPATGDVTDLGEITVTFNVGVEAIEGALAATEGGADTAAISGILRVTGTLAGAETTTDTAAMTGALRVTGALAATEAAGDGFAAVGVLRVTGTVAATETGADTAAVAGAVRVTGSLAASDAADTAAVAGVVRVTGTLAATESGQDTALINGGNGVQGLLAATESGADTAAVTGIVRITGSLAATDAPDTASILGGNSISGSMAASESGSDGFAAVGKLLVTGLLAAVEGGHDTSAVAGQIFVTGILNAVETTHDTFYASPDDAIRGDLNAQETRHDSMATNIPTGLGYRRVVFSPNGEPTEMYPMDIDEIDFVAFDYRRELIGAEKLTGAEVGVTVEEGTDATPDLFKVGNPIQQVGYVLQQVKGRVEDVTYHLRSKVTTDNGRTLVSSANLPVKRL